MNIEQDILPIIHNAGKEIMKVYETDFDVTWKIDKSPLTEADYISHEIIIKGLKRCFPDIPIISEEDSAIGHEDRFNWDKYFLIDPLDGTKEFLKKNGEFTVNIALIEKNRPVFGMIHIPAEGKTFWGGKEYAAMQSYNENICSISVGSNINNNYIILTSRSHKNRELMHGISNIKKMVSATTIEIGSSKKFCNLAQDISMIYPRFGLTSEWDIAAGHAIIESLGGMMTRLDGREIKYKRLNSSPGFQFIYMLNIARRCLVFNKGK